MAEHKTHSKSSIPSPLLVLQRYVAREDVRILHPLLHVGVSCAMVQHQPLDQLGVQISLVLHLHDLNHVQIDGHSRARDGQHGIHTDLERKRD